MGLETCENCERIIGMLEQAYIYKGKIVCKECYDSLTDVKDQQIKSAVKEPRPVYCPYCKFAFEQKPKRNRKCPSCQKKIMLRDGELLTEDQATNYDERKHTAINETIAIFNRRALVNYKKSGVKYVEILTGSENTCEACLALDGKRLLVEDELINPTLPVKNCTGGYWDGHCRCTYVAVIEDD